MAVKFWEKITAGLFPGMKCTLQMRAIPSGCSRLQLEIPCSIIEGNGNGVFEWKN